MLSLHDRIRALPKETGVVLKHACQSVGVSYGTLHAQLQNRRAIPFETVEKLAIAFNVPLTYFATARGAFTITNETDQQARDIGSSELLANVKAAEAKALEAGIVPGIDMVLDWLDREGGVLRNFEFIRDKFDLFTPPNDDDAHLEPFALGKISPAAVYYDVSNEQEFRERLRKFPRKLTAELIASHLEVSRSTRYIIDDMDIEVPLERFRLSARYRRLIAPVQTEDGRRLNLVFARLIRAPLYSSS
jgi:transcriptional regulator with XRE-family HTH domain